MLWNVLESSLRDVYKVCKKLSSQNTRYFNLMINTLTQKMQRIIIKY